MLELSSTRKNKVNLTDYNCQQDVENRMLIADLSFFEHEVLQEIFFSPLKFPLKKLARSLECEESDLTQILEKLSKTGLISKQEDQILVDKEMRKYFEFQMKRFEDDFKPDMEYLQGILRKVPIHLLPSWYAIPRTSNNIFESIVEKYLLTPQIFQRYLGELNFSNPLAPRIIQDVFAAPDCKIASSDLITKYNLTRVEFEEIILLLEFSFVCCLTYSKGDDLWLEWVTPFHEWHEYLRFFKTSEVSSISSEKEIIRKRHSDYAFIEDLTALLLLSKKSPAPLSFYQDKATLERFSTALGLPSSGSGQTEANADYLNLLMKKLVLIQLAEENGSHLQLLDTANDFLDLTLEKRALYLYRHPLNRVMNASLSTDIGTEKNVREAEKSIRRVLRKQWVYFDDFIKGSIVCINDETNLTLKRVGKNWKYALPTYTDKERTLLKVTILDWLYESGMVAPGTCDGRDCFTVTPFGRFFFEE